MVLFLQEEVYHHENNFDIVHNLPYSKPKLAKLSTVEKHSRKVND